MKKTRNLLLAAMVLAVVGLAACQKEKVTVDDPTGGAYTTELAGTEWVAYDTMDAYQGTGKVVLISVFQFQEDGQAYEYDVDYADDPNRHLFCTYSYQADGDKWDMTIVEVHSNNPWVSSLVGNEYSLRYDDKSDELHMTGPKSDGPRRSVLRRLK